MSDPQLTAIYQRLEELERRLAQMVIRGKIHAVDPVKHVARVAYGPRGQQQLTGWLHWKPSRTGKAIVWWCPEIGEGVTVISDGDVSLGEILPGSYHGEFPAPSQDPDEFLIQFGDGSKVSHHRGTHKLDVVNVGDVNITTHQNIHVKCNGQATVNAGGEIIANGSQIKLNGGAGVVTGECVCHFTGKPHGDISSQVIAGK
ncbi:phage baseplate assembly protein V [Enterovibrio norvegicus]|uniref:phage baseplate assembly protein V n=1 Tax=Enterovibrio norvegicus TaxID=188144 RepID=UPI000C837B34|nr:phage baseplate assembly protein V [Enterovibrio norvegicus]PMN73157.1 hypothetical protein BCT27_12495 [Enterovibrio norvegicus]